MTFRSYVRVGDVRGRVVRLWRLLEPEARGWNAVPCQVTRFLLRDGRLVEQEWPVGAETPGAHYVVRESLPRAEEEVAMMDRSPRWKELEPDNYLIVGGVRR